MWEDKVEAERRNKMADEKKCYLLQPVAPWTSLCKTRKYNKSLGYSITGNFCGFGLKRWYLIFADFYFCGLKISAPKKKLFVLQEATTEAMLR
jgi:hypothetical protein